MIPRLFVEAGGETGREVEVPRWEEAGPVVLGRSDECEAYFEDPQISRRHCELRFEDDHLLIEDLDSKNGTRVNGEYIDRAVELFDGDRIEVGNILLVVRFPLRERPREAKTFTRAETQENVLGEKGSIAEEREEFQKEAAGTNVHFDMEEFAGCRVNNPLSEGKQTAVYTAYDREKGETVALKVIPGESPATEKDKARFLRGAECASQFEHSNMAEVYRFGEEEGVPFICLEFIEGAQLEREIQRAGEPMDLEAAFVVAQQVLETIQSVHDQGFLLRSVRPDNLILTLDMQIVMVDFDLVKPLEDAGEEITGITDFGPVGDPRYAAPELLSRPFLADQRTDVFGAGLTLYYILTGTLPFSKRGKDWVPHMAFRRAAIPFRERGIQIPDPVWNVVDKSLSNYLDNRYATAEEMLVELQRVMEE